MKDHLGNQIAKRLRQATRIERHETPDGPMHLRRKVVLHKGNGKGPAETE